MNKIELFAIYSKINDNWNIECVYEQSIKNTFALHRISFLFKSTHLIEYGIHSLGTAEERCFQPVRLLVIFWDQYHFF